MNEVMEACGRGGEGGNQREGDAFLELAQLSQTQQAAAVHAHYIHFVNRSFSTKGKVKERCIEQAYIIYTRLCLIFVTHIWVPSYIKADSLFRNTLTKWNVSVQPYRCQSFCFFVVVKPFRPSPRACLLAHSRHGRFPLTAFLFVSRVLYQMKGDDGTVTGLLRWPTSPEVIGKKKTPLRCCCLFWGLRDTLPPPPPPDLFFYQPNLRSSSSSTAVSYLRGQPNYGVIENWCRFLLLCVLLICIYTY